MGILLKEHFACTLKITNDSTLFASEKEKYILHTSEEKLGIVPRLFKKERGKDYSCYHCIISNDEVTLSTGYFVGIDWLTKDRFIHIEPKLNSSVINTFEDAIDDKKEDISDQEIKVFNEDALRKLKNENHQREVDVIAMLMTIMSKKEVAQQSDHLLIIDWDKPEIPITHKQDMLTPFLIVKFLNILQDIARKGLKKSYYKVQEDLRNRVKGKILIGQQIKQNVFKNRVTHTICEYQVFGEDSTENRFLKKVFLFCTQYVENNKYYFEDKKDILWIINFIRPTFQHISSVVDIKEVKHLKYNPFFKEYREAIKTGQQILKRFSYNITKTTSQKISTPPFWIDMPKMFELYVYAKFLEDNPHLSTSHFNYQFATYGNALDFLISTKENKIVVDAKYKLKYNYGDIHNDIRQVAGYARLNKVREKVGCNDCNGELDCVIIYPVPVENNDGDKCCLSISSLLATKINAYHHLYKVGVHLPTI